MSDLIQIAYRHLEIINPLELNRTFSKTVLIGSGGIGSTAALALVKMGLRHLTIYDPDSLELHNVGNQFLPAEGYIGRPKVVALQALLDAMVPDLEDVDFHLGYWNEDSPRAPLMISAVDNMATRQLIWDAIEGDPTVRYYLDARMGAQMLSLFAVDMLDPDSVEHYRGTLFTDEEGLTEPCTAAGIVYTSLIAGAFIANAVKRLVAGPALARETNYLIEHDVIVKSGRLNGPRRPA